LKEWTTPDSRNTPSTINLEEEEIVDAPGNDGNVSLPEQVKRPNPWRKMVMKYQIMNNALYIYCHNQKKLIKHPHCLLLPLIFARWYLPYKTQLATMFGLHFFCTSFQFGKYPDGTFHYVFRE